MGEIWKDIKNYEELYQISNQGNVRRKTANVNNISVRGKEYKVKVVGRDMKLINSNGYYVVMLCKNGKATHKRVHRLVAEAFIPNPNNYPIINHINGAKTDNRVENLEWCTYSYNNKEAYKQGLKKPTYEGACYTTHPSNHQVKQYTLDGNLIRVWNSIREAQDNLKISNISACCRKKQKTAGGYVWEYKDKEEKNA